MSGVSFLTMKNENIHAIPKALARALQHWTCYICDVRRPQILNEGSIKYAISEYLEIAKIQKPENAFCMVPRISDYKFEYSHPIYVSRTIDLKINYTINEQEKESYYEFKYARDRNITKDESTRYIDDIFRLASLVMNNPFIEAYFLLLGPKQHIQNLLSAETNVATIQFSNDKEAIDTDAYKNNIQKMLSSSMENASVIFKPSELLPYNRKGQIERFDENYKKTRGGNALKCKILPTTEITTELIHSNSDEAAHDDIIVNVWRITNVK